MLEFKDPSRESTPLSEDIAPYDRSVATPPDRRQIHDDPSGILYGRRKTDEPHKRKAQCFVTVCHWSMVAFLVINLLTGMRIGWGYLESALGGPTGAWSAVLTAIAPRGTLFGVQVITLHVTTAWLLLIDVGVYLGYMFYSRASRRLRLTGKDLSTLTQGLRASGFWHNRRALWSANVLVYWLAFTSLVILVITGVALYQVDWGLFRVLGGYKTVRLLHGLAAYVFLPYVFLHVVLQWFFGTFWSIFKMQFYRPHLKAGCIGLAIAVPVVGGLYAWNNVPKTLTATRLPAGMQPPVLDGNPNDPIWNHAKAVTVRTVKGANNPQDHVDVTVKAVHDGQRIYFRFQWADPNVSAKRFPLIKTAQGWKVLQTAMEPQPPSENVYYEDKLAMYITDVRNGSCAATCHIGEGMPNAPKGIHYTAGEIGDLWHWKSVRTDPMGELTGEPGYMDDQYFGPRQPLPKDPKERYTGGYFPDPKTGGGYHENFVKLDKDKPLTETYVRPIKLPPVLETKPNSDPTTSEAGVRWWIHESQGIPYTEEADTYPVGTVIPDMLIAPLQGDRADIRAKGAWHNGVWTLEVSRVFDTKSKYDVAFSTERPVYLSIATFNRTQVRHSEHIKPIRLVLEP